MSPSERVSCNYTFFLPFIPVTTLDEQGRPWSCIFVGPSGKTGFLSSPTYNRLSFKLSVWEGDPFRDNAKLTAEEKVLAGGIGIDFQTRQRYKFAGYVSSVKSEGDVYQVKLIVDQAIGYVPDD